MFQNVQNLEKKAHAFRKLTRACLIETKVLESNGLMVGGQRGWSIPCGLRASPSGRPPASFARVGR